MATVHFAPFWDILRVVLLNLISTYVCSSRRTRTLVRPREDLLKDLSWFEAARSHRGIRSMKSTR